MQYLYGKNHIKNIKKNYQEKYNLIFNQIIFSSKINRNSKVFVMGFSDNVLVKDLLNRGYTNIYFTSRNEDAYYKPSLSSNRALDIIEYDILKNNDESSKYDLLIINTGYDLSKLDKDFNEVLKSLKSGGVLILMYNAYIKAHSPVWSGIRDVYKSSIPNLFDGEVVSVEEQIEKVRFIINSREELGPFKSQEYNWIEEYTINEYCSLIETCQCYKDMDKTKQMKVDSQLHQTIDSNGGILKKANRMTVLSCNKI